MNVNTGVKGYDLGSGGDLTGFQGPFQAGAPNSNIVDRRHAEWRTHQLRWRWLGDTYEGGEAYRQAIYGWDLTGLPVRNLVRHKRELPDPREQNYYGVLGRPPGSDMAAQANNDDYEMRRARTPVPSFFRNCIRRHLSKIYAQTPVRKGPERLLKWFGNVDGAGNTFAEYVKDVISVLIATYGHIDVKLERPALPKKLRAKLKTKADEAELGIQPVYISYFLPEDVVWWDLAPTGIYRQVLICAPQEESGPTYTLWTPDEWFKLDVQGEILDRDEHPYTRPPIVRLFDERRFRAKNIGFPRYEDIAEITRELYNRDSELVLSDSNHAHNLIQAPEDFMQNDVKVPIGPSNFLPKKRNQVGDNVTYEGFDVIEFPKGSAESIRLNKGDMIEQIDRAALLTKPAGAAGSNGSTVAQTGISKRMDAADGNTYLSEIAYRLQKAERQICELYLLVEGNGVVDEADKAAIEICYPKDFDLFGPEELAALISDWYSSCEGAGAMPVVEARMLKKLLRLILLGEPDENFTVFDKQIDMYVQAAAIKRGEDGELPSLAHRSADGPVGANLPGTSSEPDSINAASLASAGVLVNEVY
jgi:hypothetical protein